MRRLGFLLIALALVAGCDDNEPPTGPSNTRLIVFTASVERGERGAARHQCGAAARGNVTITFNVPRDSTGAVTGGGG